MKDGIHCVVYNVPFKGLLGDDDLLGAPSIAYYYAKKKHMRLTRVMLPVYLLMLVGMTNCEHTHDENIVSTSDSEAATLGVKALLPGMTWQWQLTGAINSSYDVDMYDIDLFDASPATIHDLQTDGRIVICYFSAGSWEDWRPDASQFPEAVKGSELDGWPGERWLDIRQRDILAPLMQARLDLARDKGCDGVEPDNFDGYTNHSGFALSSGDQLAYNRWLAEEAHRRGLAIGLKNDLDQIPELVDDFDFAINEQCFEYHECDTLLPFIQAGKGVFGVEYELETDAFCPQATAWNFSWLRKNLELNEWQESCR